MSTKLNLAERRVARKAQKENQFEMCEELLLAVLDFIPDLSPELTPFMILDALASAGFSLAIADDAADTFMKMITADANLSK